MPSSPFEIRIRLHSTPQIFEETHRHALSRILKQAIVDYYREENLTLESIEYVYYLSLTPLEKEDLKGETGNVDDILGD